MPDELQRKKIERQRLVQLLKQLVVFRTKVEAAKTNEDQMSSLKALNDFLDKTIKTKADRFYFAVHEIKWREAHDAALEDAQKQVAKIIEQTIDDLHKSVSKLGKPTKKLNKDIANRLFPKVAKASEKFSNVVTEVSKAREEIRKAVSIAEGGKALSKKEIEHLGDSLKNTYKALKELFGT